MVTDYMSVSTGRTGNQDGAMVICMFCDSMGASCGAGCACERDIVRRLLAAVRGRRLWIFGLFHKVRFLPFFGRDFRKGVEGLKGGGEWLETLGAVRLQREMRGARETRPNSLEASEFGMGESGKGTEGG